MELTTLPDVFKHFDGTGRAPRASQVVALQWLSQNLHKKRIAIQGPTGIGKQAIIRAVQKARGAHVIVPSNALLDQFQETYPDVNYLKGKDKYQCSRFELSCEDVQATANDCKSCQYLSCKERAKSEPTVFNPISRVYADKVKQVETVIVDEAHKLPEMLELLATNNFSFQRHKYPDNLTLVTVVPWLREIAMQNSSIAGALFAKGKKEQDRDRARKAVTNALDTARRAETLRKLADDIHDSPDSFIIYEETEKGLPTLHISLVETPRKFYQRCFGHAEQIILLSATLPRYKAAEIFGTNDFEYLDLASPIEPKRRAVKVDYQGFTSKTDPKDIAAWIQAQIVLYGGPTLVHVTYELGKKLKRYIPDALFHTNAADKDRTLKEFKKSGGIWLAAGCSEGIDLPHEQCRLNLIPILPFANIGDPVVAARRQRFGGKRYEQNTILNFIQQVGRSTRGETDYSTAVIGDGRIARLVRENRADISPSFLEAIEW